MTTLDPIIEAVFGTPPAGLSLDASVTIPYNVVTLIVLGLAFGAVALRFYVRTMNSVNMLGADDYTMIIALICTGALASTTVIAGQYGSGKHVWTTTSTRLVTLLKVVFAEPWIYAASVTSTKVSILLLYKRLFSVHENNMVGINRVFTIMFYLAGFLVATYPIIMWITMACACRPMSFYWNQYIGATDGVCIDVLAFFLAFGIVNMVIDVAILTVPIPLIMRLQLNLRKKISVSGIMLLGSFVCVASIVRIYYLFNLTKEVDVSWILGPAFAWSSLEPSIAIISACLPTYAPLFRFLKNKGSASRSNDYIGRSTGQVGNHSQVGAGAGFGNQAHIRIEDDEMELTAKSGGTETDSMSRHSSDKQGGIMVRHQFRVASDNRT